MSNVEKKNNEVITKEPDTKKTNVKVGKDAVVVKGEPKKAQAKKVAPQKTGIVKPIPTPKPAPKVKEVLVDIEKQPEVQNKPIISILSIVLFVAAAVLVVYSIYIFSNNWQYISESAAAGQLDAKAEMANIVKYFVDGSVPYLINALILSVLGVCYNALLALKADK
ncbi:hypothetical protein AwErysi_05440 [Erysipelotrichaceae bacterium]|nr:hypothetical protein AwErysi_05440 [Erysipelotrichaceae bacterium]